MKWINCSITALFITVALGLCLYGLFNPTQNTESNHQTNQIEVIDITFDSHEGEEIEGKIRTLISEPQICQTAQDCLKAYYGCPFGCSSLVNLNNHEKISTLINTLALTNGSRCIYKCGAPPKGSPACIDHICALAETIDSQENTRKFIEENKQ